MRVPQGPILEPILFNLCVADLSQITSESECLQYPDNSIIFLWLFFYIQWLTLFSTVQKQKLWSYQLHKCQSITNLKKKNNVKCDDITLERVPEWKLLGITLDENFQLDKHIL